VPYQQGGEQVLVTAKRGCQIRFDHRNGFKEFVGEPVAFQLF